MDETYNSDSRDGSIVIPSSSVIPESSPAGDPALRSYKGQQFVIVNHTSNIRNGSEVSIWRHGFERRHLISTTLRFRMRLPNAEINLSPRGQRGRGQGVGSPRLSNLEHCHHERNLGVRVS